MPEFRNSAHLLHTSPISSVWALVVVGSQDHEGVPALQDGRTGEIFRTVACDDEEAEQFKMLGQNMANQAGMPVELRRYAQSQIVEVWEPQ